MIRRLLLPFLLSMALYSPAFAFTAGNIVTYSDSTGAHVQDSGVSAPGVASHVATSAALQASTTATYPKGVWRDDYSAGLGAPPLWYAPSGSACSLNGGNGDNGSQVKSADSKCWLAAFPPGVDVREFGADPTGATDSHGAIIAAFASCPHTVNVATTGCKVVLPGSRGGQCYLSGSTIDLQPGDDLDGLDMAGSCLKATGNSNYPLVRVNGSAVSSIASTIVENISLYGGWPVAVGASVTTPVSSGTTLTFAGGVPAGIAVGMKVYDQSNAPALTNSFNGLTLSVASIASSTVTLSGGTIGASIGTGDRLYFANTANTSADCISMNYSYWGAVRNVVFFNCYRKLYIKDSWQVELTHLRGEVFGDSAYGVYADACATTSCNNTMTGGDIKFSGELFNSFRLINATGSKVNQWEGGATLAGHAWYFCDPPSGTVICQFGNFTNVLGDQLPGGGVYSAFYLKQGAATGLADMTFTNVWAGDTFADSANSVGAITVTGTEGQVTNITMSDIEIQGSHQGIYANNVQDSAFSLMVNGYNGANTSDCAVTMSGGAFNTITAHGIPISFQIAQTGYNGYCETNGATSGDNSVMVSAKPIA